MKSFQGISWHVDLAGPCILKDERKLCFGRVADWRWHCRMVWVIEDSVRQILIALSSLKTNAIYNSLSCLFSLQFSPASARNQMPMCRTVNVYNFYFVIYDIDDLFISFISTTAVNCWNFEEFSVTSSMIDGSVWIWKYSVSQFIYNQCTMYWIIFAACSGSLTVPASDSFNLFSIVTEKKSDIEHRSSLCESDHFPFGLTSTWTTVG